ncbi:chemotaxis protein CheW [Andreesenia angusta]|uniref:Chemotaxis protein CheW n=1 Tax=Andreesenia angusta TaxID=39480 RepID=A0A1S1V9S9_9FIRM|nr:chemotaxis protein CheW [Andreesenia angusta]OHW62479.1 chemotaxis protein CheW [Andreesenia angusta]
MAEKQYVVFRLDNEEYGIGIMNVREIIPYKESIKVPNTPDFIEGIINYRGNVTPIICLKKRFNISKRVEDGNTRIIVINIGDRQVGFIVDEASQTIKLDESEIDPAPSIVSSVEREYIDGVGKKEDRLIILIDLGKILTEGEREELKGIDA